MYTLPRKLRLAAGIALAIAATSGALAADTVSQDITEARQETQIWTTYALSPYLRASDLNVSVDNGKATLTGTVEEGVNKDLAKQIALGVSGVTEVDNQIVVHPDYKPLAQSTERSYGEVIDDASITAAVKSKLLWSRHTSGLAANVDTKRGKVTLQGTADSAAARDLAGRMALNTRGVESVDNQLMVHETKPAVVGTVKDAAHEAGDDVADAWITTKVKSTLMYTRNVDGTHIAVSTKNGVVTLSGKVDSGAEHALAVELAQNVRGVKSVSHTGLTH